MACRRDRTISRPWPSASRHAADRLAHPMTRLHRRVVRDQVDLLCSHNWRGTSATASATAHGVTGSRASRTPPPGPRATARRGTAHPRARHRATLAQAAVSTRSRSNALHAPDSRSRSRWCPPWAPRWQLAARQQVEQRILPALGGPTITACRPSRSRSRPRRARRSAIAAVSTANAQPACRRRGRRWSRRQSRSRLHLHAQGHSPCAMGPPRVEHAVQRTARGAGGAQAPRGDQVRHRLGLGRSMRPLTTPAR